MDIITQKWRCQNDTIKTEGGITVLVTYPILAQRIVWDHNYALYKDRMSESSNGAVTSPSAPAESIIEPVNDVELAVKMRKASESTCGSSTERMSAALAVGRPIIEAQARQGRYTVEEIRTAITKELLGSPSWGKDAASVAAEKIIGRLTAPKPKTLEERVTSIFSSGNHGPLWDVYLDGELKGAFCAEYDAAIYREGLIARLQKEADRA